MKNRQNNLLLEIRIKFAFRERPERGFWDAGNFLFLNSGDGCMSILGVQELIKPCIYDVYLSHKYFNNFFKYKNF
jgi:hypothetical protein